MQRLFPVNTTDLDTIMSQSIITNIAYKLLNGEKIDVRAGNYTIIGYDNDYLVIDSATGILRNVRVFNSIYGAYCFSHLQTEWASELAKELLNRSSWWKFIGFAGVSTAEAAALELGVLSAPETLGLGLVVAVVACILIEHPEWLPYIEDTIIQGDLSASGRAPGPRIEGGTCSILQHTDGSYKSENSR
ncbi:MAG: hypothetical protein H5T40_05400 [Methanobacteriales archaeon]|nr:hypothetical protein [Methanobacteriales archaeon]